MKIETHKDFPSSPNKQNTLDIPDLDEDEYKKWVSQPRRNRPYIQEAFSHLTAAEREFMLNGMTNDECEELVRTSQSSEIS